MSIQQKKQQLEANEIIIGSKKLFCIPNNSAISLEDIKVSLLQSKHKKEDINSCFRRVSELAPYALTMLNIFDSSNETIIYVSRYNLDKAETLIRMFRNAFNCSEPYKRENYTKDGMEITKIVLAKKLF